jgi:hypothetical protein
LLALSLILSHPLKCIYVGKEGKKLIWKNIIVNVNKESRAGSGSVFNSKLFNMDMFYRWHLRKSARRENMYYESLQETSSE